MTFDTLHTEYTALDTLNARDVRLGELIRNEFGPEFGTGDLESLVRRMVIYVQDLRRALYGESLNSDLGPLVCCKNCEKGWHECKPVDPNDLPEPRRPRRRR